MAMARLTDPYRGTYLESGYAGGESPALQIDDNLVAEAVANDPDNSECIGYADVPRENETFVNQVKGVREVLRRLLDVKPSSQRCSLTAKGTT